MHAHAVGIDDRDRDLDAVAHALGHHAEILELGEDAFERGVRGRGFGKADVDMDVADAQAALFIACQFGGRLGDDRAGRVAELAQGEQQARAEAVGDGGEQQSRGIRSAVVAERRRFVVMRSASEVSSKRMRKL